jgi:hypothetical protein
MAEEPEVPCSGEASPRATDRVRMNVWIRRDLYDQVMKIVEEQDASITDVVKFALRDYIKRAT